MQDKNNTDNSGDVQPRLVPFASNEDNFANDSRFAKPTERDDNSKKSEEKVEEIIFKENLKKRKTELKESVMQWHTFRMLLIYLGLFFLVMEIDFLPNWLVIPVMIIPLAVEIKVRLHTQEISFYEAIKESKISIIFCAFFLIFGILCLI